MSRNTCEMYEYLIEQGISNEAMQLVVNINGDNAETYYDIEYAQFGTRDLLCDNNEDEEGGNE